MKIRSMTGYGRSESMNESCRVEVELKSVNHRYFDLNIRMPRLFNRFEASIRGVLKQYIQRGKVDLYLSLEHDRGGQETLRYHPELAAAYLTYCREISRELGVEDDVKASTLARFPDVITSEEGDVDEALLWSVLEQGLREACERFVLSREAEGENLKQDILKKLAGMNDALEVISERAPSILEEYWAALRDRIREVLSEGAADESRIAAELVIYADKICVDEEMVRLKSHIAAVEKALEEGGAVGRKLDFLAQEMNREANTTLSKSVDLTLSDQAILLKTTIEKIREQVQNIE